METEGKKPGGNRKRALILTTLLLIASLVACLGAPPLPVHPTLDPSESFLITKAESLGVPLNELYYGMLNTGQMFILLEKKDKKISRWIKEWMVNVRDYYDANIQTGLTHAELIVYMGSQKAVGTGQKASILRSLISTRAGEFAYDLRIGSGSYDDWLYRGGWKRAWDWMYLDLVE